MGEMTLKLEPCSAVGRPTGDVAYLRMPLAVSAMDAVNRFVEKAYGKDCVCTEEPKGWMTRKYGVLNGDWREMLRKGFAECFRVLRPEGVLVCKWSDGNVKVREILALTPVEPLYGHKTTEHTNTHWIAFLKPNNNLSGGS